MYAALPTDLKLLIAEYSSGIPWSAAIPEFVDSICSYVLSQPNPDRFSCVWHSRVVSENPANVPLGMITSEWEMHPQFKFIGQQDYDTGEFFVLIKGQIFFENWEDSHVHFEAGFDCCSPQKFVHRMLDLLSLCPREITRIPKLYLFVERGMHFTDCPFFREFAISQSFHRGRIPRPPQCQRLFLLDCLEHQGGPAFP